MSYGTTGYRKIKHWTPPEDVFSKVPKNLGGDIYKPLTKKKEISNSLQSPQVPSPPQPPRNDFASKLSDVYSKMEKDEKEERNEHTLRKETLRVSHIPYIPYISTRCQPRTRKERCSLNGYFRPVHNANMVVFPSLKVAKDIIHRLGGLDEFENESFLFATLFFEIPVLITFNNDIYSHLYRYSNIEDAWGESKNCLVLKIGRQCSYPIILEDDYQEWSEYFTKNQQVYFNESLRNVSNHLDFDIPATAFLKQKCLHLANEPSELQWNAIRLIYFLVKKCEPIRPLDYPAKIYIH